MFLIVLLFIHSVPDDPRLILLIPPLCCSSVPQVLSLHLSCCLSCSTCVSLRVWFYFGNCCSLCLVQCVFVVWVIPCSLFCCLSFPGVFPRFLEFGFPRKLCFHGFSCLCVGIDWEQSHTTSVLGWINSSIYSRLVPKCLKLPKYGHHLFDSMLLFGLLLLATIC